MDLIHYSTTMNIWKQMITLILKMNRMDLTHYLTKMMIKAIWKDKKKMIKLKIQMEKLTVMVMEKKSKISKTKKRVKLLKVKKISKLNGEEIRTSKKRRIKMTRRTRNKRRTNQKVHLQMIILKTSQQIQQNKYLQIHQCLEQQLQLKTDFKRIPNTMVILIFLML